MRLCLEMKIAYVSDVLYPYTTGGSEKRIWEISRRLAKQHEVHIFSEKWLGSHTREIQSEGVTIHFIGHTLNHLYTKEGKRSVKESAFFALSTLKSLLFKKFDIIDCNQSPMLHCFSGKFSSLGKCPLILTIHEVWGDYWYEYLGGVPGFFGKTLEQMIVKLPTVIITVSETTRKKLITLGIDAEKIHVIPNGVDVEAIQNSKRLPEEYDVIYVGRLIRTKIVDCLLESILNLRKEIPDVKCAIVGGGVEM